MSDPRLRKWAKLLTEHCSPVEAGDEVVINSTELGKPLVVELMRAVLERDGIPFVRMIPAESREIFFEYASDEVLESVPELLRLENETMDVLYTLMSTHNTRALSNVDPNKPARLQNARRSLIERYIERIGTGDLKWTGTLYPTPAYAQDAEMSMLEFTEFVFESMFLNTEDPVARWEEQGAKQQQLVDFLSGAREVHVLGPGIDLRVGVEGRPWINDKGDKNMPAGEVFTSPLEDQVNGHVAFNFPAVYQGREVRGVQLTFEDGEVVDASAEHNEAYLQEQLNLDEGARRLGEFAFGTNSNIQKLMRNTLFDEKIGGTMHMALGFSIPEAEGQNRSAIHWDIVCDLRDDSEVYVDGELFQKNGRFTILNDGLL